MRAKTFEAAFNLLCGQKIGEGIHREVFECKLDASLVVKVETDEDYRTFANAYEWRNWDENQYWKPVANWLAPCVSISPCGLILLQKRSDPLREAELPEKLPAFLTDIKPSHFGKLDGRIVCCDYTRLITTISHRLKKAEWG